MPVGAFCPGCVLVAFCGTSCITPSRGFCMPCRHKEHAQANQQRQAAVMAAWGCQYICIQRAWPCRKRPAGHCRRHPSWTQQRTRNCAALLLLLVLKTPASHPAATCVAAHWVGLAE
jgi:hypothetical protein